MNLEIFNIEMIFKKDIIKYSTNLFNKVKNWKTFCNIYHIINDENLKKDLLKNLSDLVNLIDNKYRLIKENKNDLNNLQDEKLKIFIETLEELYKGIEEKKIQIKQIKSLFDCNEENIKEKFKLFSLIKERNTDENLLYDNLKSDYNEINDELEKLKFISNNLEKYLSKFYENEIKEMNSYISKIENGTYQDYENIRTNFLDSF